MYGTVARLRLKANTEAQFSQLQHEFEALNVPGFVRSILYRMDADPREAYLVVLFDSKQSYRANAESAEQDARYRQMLTLLEGEPEWHDGEIVYVGP